MHYKLSALGSWQRYTVEGKFKRGGQGGGIGNRRFKMRMEWGKEAGWGIVYFSRGLSQRQKLFPES